MTIFKVEGSKGNIYKITKEGDNYKCECKSFYYNRYTCKHIENIKQNLRNKNKTEMSQKSSKKKEMSDDAKVKFAKDSIKKLRDKILVGSTTNQNKLINFKHSDRGRGYTRIVDELNIKRSEIPAVTHVDYSARIQTVHKEINTKYYNLI